MSFKLGNAAGSLTAILAFVVTSAVSPPSLADDTFGSVARQIQIELEETYGPDQPGAAVLITLGDEEIIRTAVGRANLELDVDLAPEMIFRIASITKQFTAAAILRLQDEGRLSVDDTVGMHLPSYPAHGAEITLRQLLQQTSGLDAHHTHAPGDVTVDELIAEFSGSPLTFEPGSHFQYNNNNYNLLGAIIERLTGQSYGEYLKEAFFDPLELNNTAFDNPREVITGRATGYMGDIGWLTNARYVSMTIPYAAGALRSTTDDLTTWNRALFSDEIISAESLSLMLEDTADLASDEHMRGSHTGGAEAYGYGLYVGEIDGYPKYGHSGGVEGFGSYILYVPDLQLSIVILQNSSSWPHPWILGERFAELIIAAQTGHSQ